ncbi:MAG TPA: hypothetical protein VKA60_03405 [Blastocatellia bacterium]|nr:hypothetical protein [Blastocatellia bacterium]
MEAAIMNGLLWVGQKAGSKLLEVGLEQALGIKIQGITLEAYGKQAVLAIFAMQSMRPEPDFETQAKMRFDKLERQIESLREDLKELKDEMADFRWQVQTLLYEHREEDLWQTMLQIENSADSYYSMIQALGTSKASLKTRQENALTLANTILSSPVVANIANTRLALLGDDVGGGGRERVRGLLEIWKQQALREADLGWSGNRLIEIYSLLEAKFTRALLIQLKCARLLMEAHQTRHLDDDSHKSATDYFADQFYPMLKTEVFAFRDIIESLAINLLPLPDQPLSSVKVPSEISVLLAAADLYVARALSGKLKADAAAPATGRTLEGLPALAGCWGRVIVPGTRWIRRAPGSKEAARATITAQGGRSFTCKGRLEVRSVSYTPYKGKDDKMLHQGYELFVSGTPREMDKMLLAQFVPEEVLPADVKGPLDVRLEDPNGELLAQSQALLVPATVDEKQQATVPYGTFTMSFTGGAQVRRR